MNWLNGPQRGFVRFQSNPGLNGRVGVVGGIRNNFSFAKTVISAPDRIDSRSVFSEVVSQPLDELTKLRFTGSTSNEAGEAAMIDGSPPFRNLLPITGCVNRIGIHHDPMQKFSQFFFSRQTGCQRPGEWFPKSFYGPPQS